jgi:hypothetical protein
VKIAHTWDGRPLPVSEVAELAWWPLDDVVVVRCVAPFADDPAPDAPPGALDGLWDFEVVEWFVVGADTHYLEVELGPHAHHLALRLQGVRNATQRAMPMPYDVVHADGWWAGEARVPRAWLPPAPTHHNAYRISGTAPRHYAAHTAVPGPAPDFHRLEHFAPLPAGALKPGDPPAHTLAEHLTIALRQR